MIEYSSYLEFLLYLLSNLHWIAGKRCNRECIMSLDVLSLVQRGSMAHSECILCGTCADVCSKGVIRYSFRTGIERNVVIKLQIF